MTQTKTMDFDISDITKGKTAKIRSDASDLYLQKISTGRILWHLVNRHKFGLVTAWAVFITIQWAFPPAFDMLRSLI